MMKKILPIVMIAVLIVSCKSNKETSVNGDNSMTSLDWNGTYVGTTPCADCEGIKTVISLNDDLTFTKKTQYLGKSTDVYTENGSFSWNKAGNTVSLKTDEASQDYFVGEHTLTHLDLSGKKITGDLADKYILKQQGVDTLKNLPWKLVELRGKSIENAPKQPYLILGTADNRVSGNTSCNGFGGEFELLEGNRIKFSKMMHTMMACPNMAIENEFMQVLEVADNYSVVNGVLNLNKGRMATMAKFEVDYFVN
ncbi:copper homeostasis protein [Formosa agariphila KMM 3901]|uniref:Copper homeostasis protein n=1 Tax=Formosa agariphila (strain DSM 15362 / KCTC 12365 / LMG 23005 / KMM 3901 / M-2Alg 35-1) TaxID=1347342 RepID=T2KGD1_FORAG|nr:copper resistance protein NlpE N-terminal domain-containing protein [Formosa agariphila]CDF77827.1 copper homeostasis protein [Formosa agariphila KMM 3901]